MDHPGPFRHPADREAADARRPRPSARSRSSGSPRRPRRHRRRERPAAASRAPASTFAREAARRSRRSRARGSPPAASPSSARGLRRRDRVGLALRAGGGVRDARVDQHRLRLRPLEVALGDGHRRGLDPVRRPQGGSDGSAARSARRRRPGLPDGRIPAATPLATKPSGAVTDTARPCTPAEPEAGGLLEPEGAVDVLDRLTRCALAEVVLGADHDRPIREAVGEDADLGSVRVLDAREVRRDALRQHLTTGLSAYASSSSARRSAPVERTLHVAIRPRRTGSRCGVNETGKPSSWAISGTC